MSIENKNKITFDKLTCIICNKKIETTELQHQCNSRSNKLDIHLTSTIHNIKK